MVVDSRASALQIRLFGTVLVAHKSRPSEVRPTHAVQLLLAYLVLNRRKTHAREVLGGLFWGEHTEAQARSCLSTALWRVRQVLEPDGVSRGTYLLTLRSGEVGFNQDSDHWLDVAEFENGLRNLARLQGDQGTADWASAESALRHYTADLLEGFYDDWALRERERLRLLYLEGLQRLLTHYSQIGATPAALEFGRRILELDPLREEIHREVIRLHLRNGHRALAVQQFQLCRTLLEQELGVEPLEETQALARELAADAIVLTARAGRGHTLMLPQLRAVAQSLEETRQKLARAIQLAEAEEKSAG